MRQDCGVWVGLLDLDESETVAAIGGSERPDVLSARILVRVHHAPIGYVTVGLRPLATLTERARAAAEDRLADALHRHMLIDQVLYGDAASGDWTAQVNCPRLFPAQGGEGISIVICSRNRPDRLRECLSSLRQVAYSPLEILVVDNAPSGPETSEVVMELAKQDARIRYICEPEPGLSRARNRGFSQAAFDLVAFTDDDTVVDPGWPAAIASGFAADPKVECITGLVTSRSLDTPPERYFDSRYPWGMKFDARRYDLQENRGSSNFYPFSAGIFGTGANFAVRRLGLRRIGGFDPLLGAGSLTRGGEDLDVFFRVILAGGRICYMPSALVWHQHRADTGALASQLYAYGHGLGAYLAKRVTSGEMTAAVLAGGILRSVAVAGQMRRASQAGQFKYGGGKLALMEACGVIAGAACYYRLVRQVRCA
jgi:GT2 family glycosyltransferase